MTTRTSLHPAVRAMRAQEFRDTLGRGVFALLTFGLVVLAIASFANDHNQGNQEHAYQSPLPGPTGSLARWGGR